MSSNLASDPFLSAWVAANAGAGKTYTLANRVARLLLAEVREHGSRTDAGMEVEIPASNEELAKRIGSVREVISRTLSRMENDGLITQHPPQAGKHRSIVISDEVRLARYGE